MNGDDDFKGAVLSALHQPLDEAQEDEIDDAPSPPDESVNLEIVKACAALDLSDTDNGVRLRRHFGGDLVAISLDEETGGVWAHWDGRRWDRENGAAGALRLAQRVGPLIALESEYLGASDAEKRVLDEAEPLYELDDPSKAQLKTLRQAGEIQNRIGKRRTRRFSFGVSSKNAARVNAMLAMAAPHMRRPASAFNAEPLRLVTQTHTLEFEVGDDLDCPDPAVKRRKASVRAVPEFRREHYVTGVSPCDYDPGAAAPKFMAFLEETMPDVDLRRTLQQYCAGGLLGVLEQRVMYHYGTGANGKSVFLAVLAAVVGPSLCVSLPKETLMGQGERGAGQASPDLVRLLGKRALIVSELKDGEEMREDLVKRLTGGDPMVVRGLYESFLEFPNVATPHMSGNGQPKITGGDEGIWRRLLVMHWSVTIPEERRRDFNEIVADLLTERSGVLNWLIEGVVDYLENGLVVAEAARQATAEYRGEMDQVREFRTHCLVAAPGASVQANRMYAAYQAWAKASARAEYSGTRFGKELKRWVKRDETGSVRRYLNVDLTEEAARRIDGDPRGSWTTES